MKLKNTNNDNNHIIIPVVTKQLLCYDWLCNLVLAG